MFANFLPGGVLVEPCPNGESSLPLQLPEETAQVLADLLTDDKVAAAVGAVFLAGVRAGERSLATGRRVGLADKAAGD
jgi:hypothetical protein